jgi:hypothetical protein
MPITPQQLIEELAVTGRHVTLRALTDWRSQSRQLLPPLTGTGRGRGKGKCYAWTGPDIIDRAAFITDLEGRPTEKIILGLWCCGFDVPTAALRKAWHHWLRHALWGWSKQEIAEDGTAIEILGPEALEDVFHRMAKYGETYGPAQGLKNALNSYQFWQFGMQTVFGQSLSHDAEEDITELNSEFNRDISDENNIENQIVEFISIAGIDKLRRIVNVFSINNAILNAPEADFDCVAALWNKISVTLGHIVPEHAPEIGLTAGRQARAVFGPIILACAIAALQTPGEKYLREIFGIIDKFVDQVEQRWARGEWRDFGEFKKSLENMNFSGSGDLLDILAKLRNEI